MKQINKIITAFLLFMIGTLFVSILFLRKSIMTVDKSYLVEINRLEATINGMESEAELASLLVSGTCESITEISYLKGEATAQEKTAFFKGYGVETGMEYTIRAITNANLNEEYVRYEYIIKAQSFAMPTAWIVTIFIAVMIAGTILLLYLKFELLRPFAQIETLPYELAKGNYVSELKESSNRYYGKFLWGLDRLREELQRNQYRQMELEREKKLMILTISHDIKTPLSSIYLYAKALEGNLYEEEEKKREMYQNMQQKVSQIEQFIGEIEQMSTTELLDISVDKEEHYISEFIEPIKKSYEGRLKLQKTDWIVENYEDRLVYADLNRVQQVFQNLIENAMKYGDGMYIKISFSEEEYCQLITVTNSGTPVKEVHFSHIFESFWRGENATGKKGSGLGLYICKTIMNKLEGDIFAEAGEDCMSFTLVFPLYE